jgi:hypothetical protein
MSSDTDLASWLRRWLPRNAGRAARFGELPPGIAAALPAGLAVDAGDGEPGAPVEVAFVAFTKDAADAEGLDALLPRVAARLASGGRLFLLRDPPTGVDEAFDRSERALLEAGFVVRPGSVAEEIGGLAADHDGYTIRPYRPGDEREILELFRRSFHVERALAHWSWKYESNPEGARHVSLARDPSGRLVGQYCAYPVRLHRDGRMHRVHQVGDTMTAPEARAVGRGPTSILARAARHFYATFCRGSVLFNYGFNTGNIQRFSIRFVGATKVEEVPFRVRDLDRWPLRPRRRLFGGFRPVLSPAPAELDALWRRSHRDYGALVVRDAEYLRWRYLDCPDQDYTLLGIEGRRRLAAWGVFSRREDRLVWGDLLLDPAEPGAIEPLLAAALERLGSSGPKLNSIVGWFPPRPEWLDRLLEASGFERRPEPQQLALMVVPFDDPLAPEHCGRELFYTYGDSDLF